MEDRLRLVVLLFVSIFGSVAAQAQSTFTVDRLSDLGEGEGLMGDLRYCITNASSGADTITLAVTGSINLTRPLPALNTSVNIEGPGANLLTVRPDYIAVGPSIFTIAGGTTVLISGLSVREGWAIYGGGIFNGGTLTISDSTVEGNRALIKGAGIFNHGVLMLRSSTVYGNGINTLDDLAWGAGIYNANDGTVVVTNSTVANNRARGIGTFGGGISNDGILTISNSTVAGNGAEAEIRGFGGGIYTDAGLLHSRNTIIAANFSAGSGDDIEGNLGSLGHNLIGSIAGGFGFDPTDLLDADPRLGPLQDNGGPTPTFALLPGSPAIDAGDNTDAPEFDQRGPGFSRIVNDIIDIGAFEVQ